MRAPLFITFFSFLLFASFVHGQKRFKVEVRQSDTGRDVYCFVGEDGNLLRQLDSARYVVSFNRDHFGYFAVFLIKGRQGWWAIDADEKELFEVYNTSIGEPSPDDLIENKIRIVDENELIGFADDKGKIVIKPQFEIASSFYRGKAMIGAKCKKVPWDEHAKESDCHHYSIICGQQGYINDKGDVVKMGDYSYEQIKKEIGWKSIEDE